MSGNTKDTNPKDAIGSTKPYFSTIPEGVQAEIGCAMLEGAAKYRRHNYRIAGIRFSVYYDAARRHITKWWEYGQDIDPDSGLHHVTKAIASLVVLRDAMINNLYTDDRPPSLPIEHLTYIEERTAEILKKFPNPKPAYTIDDQVQANAKEMAVALYEAAPPPCPMQPGQKFSYYDEDHNKLYTTISAVETNADHWVVTMEDGSRWLQRFGQDPYVWTRMDYAKD